MSHPLPLRIAFAALASFALALMVCAVVYVDTSLVRGTVGVIVFDGNSLTAGYGADPRDSYPSQVRAMLPRYDIYNFGVSAQTTKQMLSDAPDQIDAAFHSYEGRKILVAWEIANDLHFGAKPDEAFERFARYCRDRRAAGFKVVVLTLLPRTHPETAAGYEVSRVLVNNRLRAEWRGFADALADVAADSRIGDAGDELDKAFYVDKVHLNKEGYALVAQIVKNAIESLDEARPSR